MKISGFILFGIIGLLPQWRRKSQRTVGFTKKGPLFKTQAPLREGQFPIGTSVGIFGGTNFAQDGTLDVTSPFVPGVTASLKTKDSFGGVAGIRADYSWAAWNNFNSNFACFCRFGI